MDQLSIGEFARRSRLSAKALRLYDELGLLPPARVDEDSGYRFYEVGQLKQARLIAALRQLQVSLAEIKAILPLEPVDAAERVREFWAATEAGHTSRRALAARCPELTLRAEAAHQEAFVKIGDGQIDGADWEVVSRSLEAWSEQQQDMRPSGLGLRITYLPSDVELDTYQDFAVPFNGQSRE